MVSKLRIIWKQTVPGAAAATAGDEPTASTGDRTAAPSVTPAYTPTDLASSSTGGGYLPSELLLFQVSQSGELPPSRFLIRVRVQIRHFKTCTTDIYLQNECAHVGLSVHAPEPCGSVVLRSLQPACDSEFTVCSLCSGPFPLCCVCQ